MKPPTPVISNQLVVRPRVPGGAECRSRPRLPIETKAWPTPTRPRATRRANRPGAAAERRVPARMPATPRRSARR